MKYDLEKIETFSQGVQAYRIIPAGDLAQEASEPPVRRTEADQRLGEVLREKQQRARQNRA